jgi:hypothetical protein
MRDVLPAAVLGVIADHYRAGVRQAERMYPIHAAEEDALTGALGQAISMPEPRVIEAGRNLYQVQISYRKIRGRGVDAPDKRYGTDGIFQIEVLDRSRPNGVVWKGLPFQAKKNWRTKDLRLKHQAELMVAQHGGIIVDYSPRGYSGCSAADAAAWNGSKISVSRVK